MARPPAAAAAPLVVSGTDPFLCDHERLEALATPPIVRRGIAYFKENRVTELGWSAERVTARVDGTRPGGYFVDIGVDEDGDLVIDCDCPFDWEPACKHAIAVLLAYAARQPVTATQVGDAAAAAVEARAQRGRTEVRVKHVAGSEWLGTWEAQSVESAALGLAPWRVELRAVGERLNHCTCPDFATNRLGTCKHIEAVLHRLRRRSRRRFDTLARTGPAASIIHLEWGTPGAPRIRVRRAATGAPRWLDRHFDADGFLRDALPDAFDRLQRSARGRADVVIAGEVAVHVARLAEEAARRERTAAIARRIRASGGTLPGVSARLYPYQVEGVAFLAGNGRALLADDMGLGKTLQAIAAACVLQEEGLVRRALVVCPASLKHQWARELRRFTGAVAVVVEGGAAARRALYRQQAAYTIVNYEMLLRDGDVVQATLAPDLLVLDEAQRIRNWRTRTAAAVRRLETAFAFVLTGTPLENRLEDLYSLMQVVDARVLGPLWRYLLDFHVTDERGRVLGYRNLSELRRRLAPVMLRRDRALVRDQLPERSDARLDVPLDRHQRPLHDDALASAANIAARAQTRPLTPSEEKALMAALQNARMACNAAGLVDGETQGSPKLSELATLLDELCIEGGRKVVIFSQWERMTKLADEVARGLGIGTVRLHGSVPAKRRGALIDRFRDDPAVQVFLSTDAGGVGLNLQWASVVINLDLPWNPAVLEQRIARVHRLGQAEPVHAVLIVAKDSYEERIASLIAAKRELFRHVVTEDASADVVGVSRKLVEIALASLGEESENGVEAGSVPASADAAARAVSAGAGSQPPPAAEPAAGDADSRGAAVAAAGSTTPAATAGDDEAFTQLVAAARAALGEKIERIVAVGGGMIIVADAAAAAAASIPQLTGADAAPVALIDPRSWAALSALGTASPLAGARTLFDAAAQRDGGAPPAQESAAARKLRAATALAESGHGEEAVGLAAAAMLHAAASLAGLAAPPASARAAVWLHTELLPRGVITTEQGMALGRALALAGAPEVPAALVEAVLADAGGFVRAGAGAGLR